MELIGIATKARKGERMREHEKIAVSNTVGLVGDRLGRGGPDRKRQVTVLSVPQWNQACRDIGGSLSIFSRRANLYVSDACFGPRDVGRLLCFGPALVLEITGETEPCERMDQVHPGLKEALAIGWCGGITCRVAHEGAVALGHKVFFIL